jgi:hypothetical protein
MQYLFLYNFQDSNSFIQQVDMLRAEIDSRMVYNFPEWVTNSEFTYQTVESESFLESARTI